MSDRQKHYAKHLRYDEKYWRRKLKQGDVEYVRDAIKYDLVDYGRQHLLFIVAAIYGHADIVKLLIERGADVHADHDIALLKAAKYGHVEVMEVLIEAGADVYANDGKALQGAVERGHLEAVKLLLASMKKVSPLKMIKEVRNQTTTRRLERVDPNDCKCWSLVWASANDQNEIIDVLFDDLGCIDALPDELAQKNRVKAAWERWVIRRGMNRVNAEIKSGREEGWMGL